MKLQIPKIHLLDGNGDYVYRSQIPALTIGSELYKNPPERQHPRPIVVVGNTTYRIVTVGGEDRLVDTTIAPVFLPYEDFSDSSFELAVGGSKANHQAWYHMWKEVERHKSFVYVAFREAASEFSYRVSYDATRHLLLNRERVTFRFFDQIPTIEDLPSLDNLANVTGRCRRRKSLLNDKFFLVFVSERNNRHYLSKMELEKLKDIVNAPDASYEARIFKSVLQYYYKESNEQCFIGS